MASVNNVSQMAYIIGIAAGITAGIAFNLGIVIQKMAVMHTTPSLGLMRQLLRTPLWLAGFGLQVFLGVPLNIIAQTNVGPSLVPGLMAGGMIVLAVGAVRLTGESLDKVDILGILFIIAAVTCFGFSQLSVNIRQVDLWESAFLLRLAIFTTTVFALSFVCHFSQNKIQSWRGLLRTLNAGLLLAQTELWLGILLGFLFHWSAGGLLRDFLASGAAAAILSVSNILGIAENQRTLQIGEAAKMIPIQNIPIQILPVVSYLAVFSLKPGSSALLFTPVGIALVLAGSGLLARRQVAA